MSSEDSAEVKGIKEVKASFSWPYIATSHASTAAASAGMSTLQQQLAHADERFTTLTAALGKSPGDCDQIEATQSALTAATTERDRVARDLTAAQQAQAQAESNSIKTEGDDRTGRLD
jgi:hypothetical protein